MFNRSYSQERGMEKRGQKELFTTLECLNYKKSSQQEKKKKETETKSSAWVLKKMPKLAQILEE